MITLTKEQVLMLHKAIYDRFGGSCGVRDEGLLDSALEAPFQTFAGEDLYKTDLDKIVRFGYGLIRNHPFADGNKRIGALSLLTLLKLNVYDVDASNDDLTEIIMGVAAGEKDENDLREWVKTRC